MKFNLTFVLVAVAIALLLVVVSFQFGQQSAVTSASSQGGTASTLNTVPIGADEAACPVMGEVKKKADMIPVNINGTTYYLCCETCRPKLIADPAKYIGTSGAGTSPGAFSTTPAPVTIAADEAACPVMGMVKKKVDMIKVAYQGKTYYLCCQDCQPKFLANAPQYILNPTPPSRELCQ